MTTDGTDGHTYQVASITDESHIVLGQNFQLPGRLPPQLSLESVKWKTYPTWFS